jgi:hypothetical protein
MPDSITVKIRGEMVNFVFEVTPEQWAEIDKCVNGHGKNRRQNTSRGTKDVVTLIRESIRLTKV